MKDEEDLKIDLRNRLVVWYRAIHNRPAEVVGVVILPKTVKEVKACWQQYVDNNDGNYEDMTELIPEYQDLKKLSKETKNPDDRLKASRKMSTFNVHTAIVERKTVNILTLHYGMPKHLFPEFFDISRVEEVKKAIYERLKGNKWYN